MVLKVPEGSKQAIPEEFFRVLRKVKRHQLLPQNASSKLPRTAQRGISLKGAAGCAYEMNFAYFPVNPFGPWSVEVDQGQPWAALQKAGRGGVRQESQDYTHTESRRNGVFLLFVVNRDAIPRGHSTVMLPNCPHWGKAQE